MRFSQLLIVFLLTVFYPAIAQTQTGTLKGKITIEGESSPGTKIFIVGTSLGTLTDLEGNYSIIGIPAGSYTIQVNSMESEPVEIKDVIIDANKITYLDRDLELVMPVETLKPIIYIYPEDTLDVQIKLKYAGEFTVAYPLYTETGWQVSAYPDGTLRDSGGRSYYALYWEGIPHQALEIYAGQLVPRHQTLAFLEKNLALLGLNEREANEFIIYWLPVLQKSAYNVISFSTDEYETQAELEITPQPETLIRVMMLYMGTDKPVAVEPQNLETLRVQRHGYTVVEWGGQASFLHTDAD